MIWCDECGWVPEKEENLPVLLPTDVEFTGKGESPITTSNSFIDTVCPPHAGYAAYNVCPSKTKAMFYSIGRGHDANSGEGGKALSEWMSNIK